MAENPFVGTLPCRISAAFALLALVVTVGCVSAPVAVQRPTQVETAMALPATVDASPSDPAASSPAGSATRSFSLDWAIEQALLHNPDLQADFAAFQAQLLQKPQVTALPDPIISYTQFVDEVQTRVGEQQFIVGLSQRFPWLTKLTLQGQIAEAGARAALAAYRARMLEIRREVARAFYELAYLYEVEALVRKEMEYVDQIRTSATTLYETGRASRQPSLRAETAYARVQQELALLPAQIRAQEVRLNRLMHRPAEAPLGRPETGPLQFVDLAGIELAAEARAHRPELERYDHLADKALKQEALARKDYMPDFSVGMNYIGIGDNPAANPGGEGDDAWNLTLGFTIPLPHAGRRAAIAAAQRRYEEARLRRESAERSIEADLEALVARMAGLEDQIHILQTTLLPFAEEALETSRSEYLAGTVRFLDLLDSERVLIDTWKLFEGLRRDYQQALADLERLLGVQVQRITPGKPAEPPNHEPGNYEIY